MAKSKKKYKKKKNPNRTARNQNRKSQSASARTGKASGTAPLDPERQKRVWIAAVVAIAAFALLILIAYFNGQRQNAEIEPPDAETTQELTEDGAEATAEGGEESEETDDGESADDAQSGDTSDAEHENAQATSSTDNGTSDAETAADNGTSDAETADNGTSEAATDNGVSDAAATDSGETNDEEASVQYADITVKDYGVITVELDPETAPITVQNFTDLAKSGFYDGLTFHRIMDGFMIQGGDPLGNGTGGADKNIVGEFAANGYQNAISHTRGAISMARASGDNDSASSQFFIMQADNVGLDGQYAAFGHVTSGMEVVDKICADAHPTDNNGTIPKEEQPIIETIVIRDK